MGKAPEDVVTVTQADRDAEFLRDLAGRVFRYAAPLKHFDQGDSDRLYILADRLASIPASAGVLVEAAEFDATEIASQLLVCVEPHTFYTKAHLRDELHGVFKHVLLAARQALSATIATSASNGVTAEDATEIGRVVRWIDQAIERAKRHGNTEGIWLFASQWRTVRNVLAATAATNTDTPNHLASSGGNVVGEADQIDIILREAFDAAHERMRTVLREARDERGGAIPVRYRKPLELCRDALEQASASWVFAEPLATMVYEAHDAATDALAHTAPMQDLSDQVRDRLAQASQTTAREIAAEQRVNRPCGTGCNNPECCEVRCLHPIPATSPERPAR